jgi:hypothetical protein
MIIASMWHGIVLIAMVINMIVAIVSHSIAAVTMWVKCMLLGEEQYKSSSNEGSWGGGKKSIYSNSSAIGEAGVWSEVSFMGSWDDGELGA